MALFLSIATIAFMVISETGSSLHNYERGKFTLGWESNELRVIIAHRLRTRKNAESPLVVADQRAVTAALQQCE
jgi:hypothetical protein